jgi:hypothetical protein
MPRHAMVAIFMHIQTQATNVVVVAACDTEPTGPNTFGDTLARTFGAGILTPGGIWWSARGSRCDERAGAGLMNT